jgi:sirohydrochlorin ferrochelatase
VSEPALVLVAHGSPDPRAEPVLEALTARIRSERPGLVVVLAHLGHAEPDVPRALRGLVQQGVSRVVVVPLLLTAAYHAKVDLPALLREARVEHPDLGIEQAAVLGPHPLLFALLRRRLAEAGAETDAAVVLGAIGTSDAAANAELADVAATLGATIGFATGTPSVAEAVTKLRAAGARCIAVASYVLAPGQLPDRFRESGADIVTEVLGAAGEIADVALWRYDEIASPIASAATPGYAETSGDR